MNSFRPFIFSGGRSVHAASNTMTVWGADILLNTFCNLAKEFWPDLRRKIHNRHPE